MGTKKILFVVSPQEFGYGYINSYFWQHGILHLAAYLKSRFSDLITVNIIDGNIRSLEDCRTAILNGEYDIIGFHCVDHTRKYTLELAQMAFKHGCKNILFGGAGAIFNPKQYLINMWEHQDTASIICCIGAGEETLEGLMLGKPLDKISNIMYLSNNEIIKSKVRRDKPTNRSYLDNLPFDLYKDIDYYINLQLNSHDFPYTPITYSAISHYGCIHRLRKKGNILRGCSFCAIPFDRYCPRDPNRFWEEISQFNKFCKKRYAWEVNSIKDWGDSVTESLLRTLLETRPSKFENIKYSCYLNVSEIRETTLQLLKDMNCFSVYIGIDGTNNQSLENLDKGYNLNQIWEGLKLIDTFDFKLEIGTILGVKGETSSTLKATVEFIKNIWALFKEKIIVLQGNILIPMPGSKIFEKLRATCINNGESDPIFLNVQERVRLWLKYFTNVTFDECIKTQKLIESISPRKHSYIGFSDIEASTNTERDNS